MRKLTDEDHRLLQAGAAFFHWGGIFPSDDYRTYQRLEKLRRRRLLSFAGRRNRQWRLCCYLITNRGFEALKNAR